MNEFLKSGDTVAIISPSVSLNPRLDIKVGVVSRYLKSLGLKIIETPTAYTGLCLTDDSDAAKAADIMSMYRRSEVKALFAIHGGAASLRILPFLDFEQIKKNPKPIIGFSDTSSIQMGIYAQTGLPYISGFLGEYEFRNSAGVHPLVAKDLKAVFAGKKFRVQEGETLRGGLAEGTLIGGNLSILSDLNGTPYYPDIRGSVILIEDECEKPYKINLMLTQLRLNPLFKDVRGIVFGKFSECEDAHSAFGDINNVIDDFVKHTNVPVIKNFNYGHFPDRHVLMLGVPYRFDADKCILEQL